MSLHMSVFVDRHSGGILSIWSLDEETMIARVPV